MHMTKLAASFSDILATLERTSIIMSSFFSPLVKL